MRIKVYLKKVLRWTLFMKQNLRFVLYWTGWVVLVLFRVILDQINKKATIKLPISRFADKLQVCWNYNFVLTTVFKDSNADSGIIFKFLQNLPISKAVCTKISKYIFVYFEIFWYFWEKIRGHHFFLFWIFKLKKSFFNQDH